MTRPLPSTRPPAWMQSLMLDASVLSSPPQDNETPAHGQPIVSTHYYRTYPMGNNPFQSILLSVLEAVHLAFADQEVYPEEIRLHPTVQELLAAETGDGLLIYLPGDQPCRVRPLEALSVGEVKCLFRISATHLPLEGR